MTTFFCLPNRQNVFIFEWERVSVQLLCEGAQMISATEQINLDKNPRSGRGKHTEVSSIKAGVIDLCCGMGGLSLAAKELGLHVLGGVT